MSLQNNHLQFWLSGTATQKANPTTITQTTNGPDQITPMITKTTVSKPILAQIVYVCRDP